MRANDVLRMSAVVVCRKNGLVGMDELCELTGKARRTLNHWAKNDPHAFYVLVLGAAVMKERIACGQEDRRIATFEVA